MSRENEKADYRETVRRTMVDLTRSREIGTSAQTRLGVVTAAAVNLIRGATCADVIVINGDECASWGSTADIIVELDAVQMQFRQGPCWEAASADAIIRVSDLTAENRWSEFTSRAVAAGIRSSLCFQLFHDGEDRAALNVFGRAAGAFNIDDEALGAVLATHAASLLIAARGRGGHRSVLADRDLVGQAKGVIMQRFVLDAATAFEIIVELSERSGSTLEAVSRRIVGAI